MDNKVILHTTDEENIILKNEEGLDLEFAPIATVPYDGEVYLILRMLTQMEGVESDEGLVFKVKPLEDGTSQLELIIDEDLMDVIFDLYDDAYFTAHPEEISN